MNSTFTYFDTHTHKKYKEDDVAFIRNAFHHLNIPQLDKLDYSFSIGLHPWDIQQHFQLSLDQILVTANHKNCIAIGECGLDYFIKTDKNLQTEIFNYQLDIAEKLNKPVIVHCVRAYHDLFPLIKNRTIPIVLHQYQGSIEATKSILSEHIYFSFGKQLFREQFNAEIFDIIPKTHFLLETDTMPIHIEEVYLKASSILDLDFDELREQVNTNAQKVFHPNIHC